jgi:hypothetical protein
MNLRKAAEMALEALENPWEAGPEGVADAIIALRQALAMQKFSEVNQEIEEALKQPEQEPVAYVTIEPSLDGDWRKCPSIKWFNKPTEGPLYTAPLKQPKWVGLDDEDVATVKNEFNRGALWAEQVLKEKNKREWVGLTDEEIEECKINGGLPHAINWRFSVKVMEAKLKEKNT